MMWLSKDHIRWILSSPTCVDLKYNHITRREKWGDLTIEQKVKDAKNGSKMLDWYKEGVTSQGMQVTPIN